MFDPNESCVFCHKPGHAHRYFVLDHKSRAVCSLCLDSIVQAIWAFLKRLKED